MRPDINRGGELRPRVEDYADRHGLRIAEAWARVVEKGLDAAENDTHDETEHATEQA